MQEDSSFWQTLRVDSSSNAGKQPSRRPLITAAQLNSDSSSTSTSSGEGSDSSNEQEESMDVIKATTTTPTTPTNNHSLLHATNPSLTREGVSVKQPRFQGKHSRIINSGSHQLQSDHYKKQIDELLAAHDRMSERQERLEALEQEHQLHVVKHQRDCLHFDGWTHRHPPPQQLRKRSPVVDHFIAAHQEGRCRPLELHHVAQLLNCLKAEQLAVYHAMGSLKLVHGSVEVASFGKPSETKSYAVVMGLVSSVNPLFYIVHALAL